MKKAVYLSKKALCIVLCFLLMIALVFGGSLHSAFVLAAQHTDRALRVNADGSFRILQIADLQDYCRPEEGAQGAVNVYFREMNTIRLAIAREQPDLIVLTGDNICGARGTLENGMTVFEYTVKKVTSLFGGIPFVVTFGNHDVENNGRDKSGADAISEAEQTAIYARYGALPLTNDIVPGDESENATAKYGTGYVDVYDPTGTDIVQRVILINSGTYEGKRNPTQYGKAGINAVSFTDESNDYAKVVAAVDRWTGDASIKCVAFQHIPLQELFFGDSAETRLLVNDPAGHHAPVTCEGSGIAGNYVLNTGNPTVMGEYNEYSGCSYSDTSALYHALADKANVVGLFFGHEHMNTATGKVTVDGKSLVIGYGGSLLVDPSAYSCCTVYAYNPIISGYTLYGNGLQAQSLPETKRVYTYYGLLRDYDIGDFTCGDTYISEVRLFAADTSGMPDDQTSDVGYFEEARAECLAAGYTPLETCYTRNSPGNSTYNTTADFNFGCYRYGAYSTGAKAVCLGYKTTSDPAKAITDVRILDGGANPPEKWTKQELWAYQNNSQNSGGNRSTENDTDDAIPFYNANYDWNSDYTAATLRADTNAQIRCCEGLDTLGEENNAWLFYTKDPQAGTPIQRIFVEITDTQSFSGKFNLNRFNTEYPYTFVQNLNATYDFDRDNTAFNVRMGYTGDFTGGVDPAAKGSWAYIGLVHAVEHTPVVVPAEPETPTETETPFRPEEAKSACSHICHATNPFLRIVWKVLNFFNKLFGINKMCVCQDAHW